MANELVLINGVTKKERNGLFVYTFGNVIIDANPVKAEYIIFDTDKHQNQKVLFADITDKLGTTDVVAYVDKLAADGYFQQVITGTVTATIDPTGLATEAKQDVGNSSLSSIDAKMTTLEASSVLAPINEDKMITALNNINETLNKVLFVLKGISE